jgi:hypothetical protein
VDLGVTVDQKSELPCSVVEAHFDSMPLSLVPIVSYELDLFVREFFDDLPSTIFATVINDDYLIVF